MRLVEPDHLASDRMLSHSLANLRSAQLVVVMPLKSHSCLQTIVLNLFPAVGLEDLAPGKIECVTIVPDVHHLFMNEFFRDCRIDLRENSEAVRERCFGALVRRRATAEGECHGHVPWSRSCV